MLNVGTLEVEVFELSYRQDLRDNGFYFGYSFSGISVEPLLCGAGYLNSNQCLQALSLEDYGFMSCGDRVLGYSSLMYNGQQFSQFAAASGPATGAASDESTSHYTATLYNLTPYGQAKGLPAYPFTPAASYTHPANLLNDSGYIDSSLVPGPCPWPQDFRAIDGTVHPSDFVLPYGMYNDFKIFAVGAECGIAFCDMNDAPLPSPGNMLAANNFYNTAFENQSGVTNVLGTFIQASTYIPANFIPWSKWKPRGQEVTASLTQTELPAEEPLQNVFQNGAYIQNARNFFILKGGQMFDGQPETPVLWNPVTNTYQPIKWLPQTQAAQQLVQQPGGMQIAYSALQNCFYMIGSPPDYPDYIFGSNFIYPMEEPVIETPPGVVLRLPRFGIVPKLSMPCYGVRAPQPKLSR